MRVRISPYNITLYKICRLKITQNKKKWKRNIIIIIGYRYVYIIMARIKMILLYYCNTEPAEIKKDFFFFSRIVWWRLDCRSEDNILRPPPPRVKNWRTRRAVFSLRLLRFISRPNVLRAQFLRTSLYRQSADASSNNTRNPVRGGKKTTKFNTLVRVV